MAMVPEAIHGAAADFDFVCVALRRVGPAEFEGQLPLRIQWKSPVAVEARAE